MAFTDAADAGDDPNAGGGVPAAGAGPGAGGADPGAGGNPTQGGGPVLAALAGQQRSPPVSAPGVGDQSNAMQMIMQAISMMQQALPSLAPGTPLHRDALKAISNMSKHMPQGAPTAGVQQTHLKDMMRNLVKNALLARIMSQQKQQSPGAANAPMPSTPLPGS
jgi:hypothetical protein